MSVTEHRRSPAAWTAAFLGATLLLCAVALVNGGPILYPDTLAYVVDGDRLAHLLPPYAVRPIYYGVALWPFHFVGYGLAIAAQAAVVAHLLILTLRASGAGPTPLTVLAATLALVVLTPVTWHVAHLLPDIFTAILILAMFLLGFCRDALRRWERWYLFLLATVSATFHVTMWPIGAALVVVAVLAWFTPLRRFVHPVPMAIPLALALAGSLAGSYAIFQRVTLTPNSPPHLLARLLADGPARDYLRATCPASGLELCTYLDTLPPTEDGFIWRMLPALPTADGKRIKAEAGQVVAGTIAMFPLQVAGHMLANGARQLVTFPSETQLSPDEWHRAITDGPPAARALAASLADTPQAHGAFDRPALDMVNAVHAAVALLCLPAAIVLFVVALRRRVFRPAALLAMIATGLLTNGFVSGAFGGVFGRYQGRVIWLLPFAVLTAALALRRSSQLDPRET